MVHYLKIMMFFMMIIWSLFVILALNIYDFDVCFKHRGLSSKRVPVNVIVATTSLSTISDLGRMCQTSKFKIIEETDKCT